jgi:hypothetical protein
MSWVRSIYHDGVTEGDCGGGAIPANSQLVLFGGWHRYKIGCIAT